MKKSNVVVSISITLAALLASFLAVGALQAAPYTWTGASGTTWATSNNWSSSVTPGTGDDADFSATFSNSPVVAPPRPWVSFTP